MTPLDFAIAPEALVSPAIPIPPTLRPYQAQVREQARAELARQSFPRRLIIQGETGSGKGKIAAALTCSAYEMQKRVILLARGRILVDQLAENLRACNLPFTYLMAKRGYSPNERIVVASKDTLASRFLRNEWIGLPHFDLAIVDEAHDAGKEYFELLAKFPTVIGLTATPAYGDGRGLGEPWKGMVLCEPPSTLIRDGYLVPTKVYAPYLPHLKGVKIADTGDYVVDQLAKHMDRANLIGDVVANWKRHGDGRPTICFACNIQHSKHIRDAFLAEGIPARHIDQTTEDAERAEVFGLLAEGKIKVLCNVAVLNRGFDLPCLSCCIIMRPTNSLVLCRQMIGRIKRPAFGKTHAIVIDHAGACYRHGLPDEDIEWKLSHESNVQDERDKDRGEGKLAAPILCEKCGFMFSGQSACPACGSELLRKTVPPKVSQGVLVEVTDLPPETRQREIQERYWVSCLFVMGRKGRSIMAARIMYKNKFGDWPALDFKHTPPKEEWQKPVVEVYKWTAKKEDR